MNITITLAPEEVELLAHLFRHEVPALPPLKEAEQPTRKQTAAKATIPVSPGPVMLTPGAVDWRVEIDGLPVHWQLDYAAGKFPAVRGDDILWQGERYRVSHLYGTSLKVTSQDADIYQGQRSLNGEIPV